MDSKNLSELWYPAISIAKAAGRKIIEVYSQHFEVDFKEDRSPLTLADKISYEVISEGLAKLSLQFPILSEKGKDIP